MAGEHSQPKSQWKSKSKFGNNLDNSAASSHRPRARSPAHSHRDSRRRPSSSRSPPRKRPLPHRSPPDVGRGRRVPASRDDDLYRPRSRSRQARLPTPPRDLASRIRFSPRRRSPRRPSPDSNVPAPKRRAIRVERGSSTYRPGEGTAYQPRSRSPPPDPRGRREPSPRHRRRSPSPRSRRPSPPRGRHETDSYAPPPRGLRRSRSPPTRRSPRRSSPPRRPIYRSRSPRRSPPRRSPARRRSPPRSLREHNQPRRSRSRTPPRQARSERPQRNGEKDMRPSYPPHGSGRGGSRPPHDPYGYPGTARSPPPPPPHVASHHQSPYGAGRGWPSHSPYPPSHHGSPYHQPSHRQASYPPPSTPGYFPPPPPQYYGGSPPYPPQGHLHPDRRASAGQSPPAGRGGPNARRGRYTNLSWTPSTGSRGGIQQPPTDTRPRESSRSQQVEDDDDDPFRPPKELRAQDEYDENQSHGRTPSRATDPDGRFKFAFKNKSSLSRQPSSASERPPKREMRLVKRIKPKPELPPEFAASDSVYYRKPGNESVVGSGTYGKVFRAIHVYTGEKVALKKIRMEGERDGFPVTAIREVKLLQSLNNDNVVRLLETMVEKNDCYMVFEYLSHDLTGLLNHPFFVLQPAHKKHLAQQMFSALDYLHRRGVLHRDIKAANILISNTGQLKLADFGLARFFAKRRQLDYTNRVITIWYRSPELLLGETQYGPAVDIWSAACVLVEIFTKHAIFPGDGGEINQLDKIYNVLGTPSRNDWPAIVDMAWFELLRPSVRLPSSFAEKYQHRVTPAAFELIQWMFAFDPKKRPSAEEVLQHAYFKAEEPAAKRAMELQELEGDWHEFESKALRKEKERKDREERKHREREEYESVKRKKMESASASASAAASMSGGTGRSDEPVAVGGSSPRERERKRVKVDPRAELEGVDVNGTASA